MIEIPSAIGPLEGLLETPRARRGNVAVALAHPHPQYGGTMHTKVVFHAAKGFHRIGFPVLRFNFRGVGRSAGSFSGSEGEREDMQTALDYLAEVYPQAELWAAGFSFGGWIALTVGAADPRVGALVAIAPPVALYDFAFLKTSDKPKFFIQGERDELCPLKDLRAFYALLPEPKELIVIDMADHLFDGHASEVGDAIVDLFEEFGRGTVLGA